MSLPLPVFLTIARLGLRTELPAEGLPLDLLLHSRGGTEGTREHEGDGVQQEELRLRLGAVPHLGQIPGRRAQPPEANAVLLRAAAALEDIALGLPHPRGGSGTWRRAGTGP